MLFLIIYNDDINELITYIVTETDKVYNYASVDNHKKIDQVAQLNILMTHTRSVKYVLQ